MIMVCQLQDSSDLQEHVPVTLEMRVESNDRLLEVTASNDFIAFVEHVKRERRTAISIVPSDGNIIIQFKCPCSAGEQPEYAKDALANWLADHNVCVGKTKLTFRSISAARQRGVRSCCSRSALPVACRARPRVCHLTVS